MSDKRKLLDAVRAMPEELSWDEIMEELAISAALDRSAADAEAGRIYTHEEVMKHFDKWPSNSK